MKDELIIGQMCKFGQFHLTQEDKDKHNCHKIVHRGHVLCSFHLAEALKHRQKGIESMCELLSKKYTKLKHLLLLTDPSVGSFEVNEQAVTQWNEFIKVFPDEGDGQIEAKEGF